MMLSWKSYVCETCVVVGRIEDINRIQAACLDFVSKWITPEYGQTRRLYTVHCILLRELDLGELIRLKVFEVYFIRHLVKIYF